MDTSSLSHNSLLSVERFQALLHDAYRIYKRDKVMPAERRAYCNGYADAMLSLGLLDQQKLIQIIDSANLEIFGMTLRQRQYEFDVFHDPQLLDPSPLQRFPLCCQVR